MIREGATPITSARDILNEFHLIDPQQPTQQQFIALEPEEQAIIDLLSYPQSRNALAQETGVPIIQMNILLSSMEIKGLIREHMGKIYKK